MKRRLSDWWEAKRPRVLSAIVWSLVRLLGSTLRVRQERVPEPLTTDGQKAVIVLWHGCTLAPVNLYRGRRYWALISLSRDGEIQNHIFQRFGFQTIRGSTGRGGLRGALEAARKVRDGGVLCFTPDGPRGPHREVQPGVLLIAQKSGAPIYPVGVSARPCRFLPTWDHYMIPLPFAEVWLVFGDAIHVADGLSSEEMEQKRLEIQAALAAVQSRAETCAGVSADVAV